MSVSDEDVLAFLRRYMREHTYAPSFREIGQAVGLAQSGVHYHLSRLEREGRIERGPKGSSRTIRVVDPDSGKQEA